MKFAIVFLFAATCLAQTVKPALPQDPKEPGHVTFVLSKDTAFSTSQPQDCGWWGAQTNGSLCELRLMFSSTTPKVTCTPITANASGQQEIVCTWQAPKRRRRIHELRHRF